MRKDLHRLEYPVFAVGILDEENLVFAAGGGGPTKSGIPNGLTVFHYDPKSSNLEQVGFLSTGSKATMSLAVHPREYAVVLGVGERCWLVNVDYEEDNKIKRGNKRDIVLGLTRAIRSEFSADSLSAKKEAEDDEFGYQKCCAFDACGLLLATGGVDGVGRLWEYPSLVAVESFGSEQENVHGQVQSVDILDDYMLVVRERAVLLYDFDRPGEPVATLSLDIASSSSAPLPSSYRCGCFGKGPSDMHVIIAGGDQLWIYMVHELTPVNHGKLRSKITCVAASSTGLIAYGCADGSIGVLTSSLSHVKFIREAHSFAVSSLCFSFNGELLVSGSAGGTLLVLPRSVFQGSYPIGPFMLIIFSILFVYLAYLWNNYYL